MDPRKFGYDVSVRICPLREPRLKSQMVNPLGSRGRNGFDTKQMKPSNKMAGARSSCGGFQDQSFAFQDWTYTDKRHKWKKKPQKNAQFPFCGRKKTFIMKLSFEEFNLVFFTARRLACFEPTKAAKFLKKFQYINESLRVSDIKREEPQEIFACRGEGHGQLRVTMITPPPTPARLVKLKKEEHRFSFHPFILLNNYIVLITIIWQNLGGREGRANAPMGSGVSRCNPTLECNIGWTRRGVPFWKENRSDGELYHLGVSNPDLLPRRAIPHTVG